MRQNNAKPARVRKKDSALRSCLSNTSAAKMKTFFVHWRGRMVFRSAVNMGDILPVFRWEEGNPLLSFLCRQSAPSLIEERSKLFNKPKDFQIFHALKFRVASDKSAFEFLCQLNSKGICIRDGVAGFDPCRGENPLFAGFVKFYG